MTDKPTEEQIILSHAEALKSLLDTLEHSRSTNKGPCATCKHRIPATSSTGFTENCKHPAVSLPTYDPRTDKHDQRFVDVRDARHEMKNGFGFLGLLGATPEEKQAFRNDPSNYSPCGPPGRLWEARPPEPESADTHEEPFVWMDLVRWYESVDWFDLISKVFMWGAISATLGLIVFGLLGRLE